ncbi:MAG: hypothetical protein R2838_19070 [Caldilineaceae bacterium]
MWTIAAVMDKASFLERVCRGAGFPSASAKTGARLKVPHGDDRRRARLHVILWDDVANFADNAGAVGNGPGDLCPGRRLLAERDVPFYLLVRGLRSTTVEIPNL